MLFQKSEESPYLKKEGETAMRLSTRCSVALHCLLFIAEYEHQTKVTSELLSKSTGCNSAAIRSILNALKKAGLICIFRGVGGAHLAQSPRQITLWDVYHALEPDGLKNFIGLHQNPSQKCPVGRSIESVLYKPYQEISASVQQTMTGITLQQLLDDYHSQTPGL